MSARHSNGRANQRDRTRKDLLSAAARLLKEGANPSMEDLAAAAMVSRATAYRYFPNLDALLAEAPLEPRGAFRRRSVHGPRAQDRQGGSGVARRRVPQ